jgi:hypothetical protein
MVDDGGPLAPVSPPPSFPSSPAPAFPSSPAPTSPLPGTLPPFDPYASPVAQAPPTYGAPAPYSPYAPSPYSPTPQALYPEGIQAPQVFPPGGPYFPTLGQPIRFLQEVRGRYDWMPNTGSTPLGVQDFETSATFAIPFFRAYNPILITPGFGMHFFAGPVTTPANMADLPARTYDAYIDAAWHPQITPWLSANLGVRTGVYTDFNTFTIHSIRIMGRGLGIVTLTPTLQVAAGVVYIDRNLIKLLPAGGIIWRPNPDARYDILFPNPKLARRYTTLGTTDIWWYVAGEYGGGAWTIQRAGGGSDDVDYNDIRVSLGVESFALSGLHGLFEVGYVFNRQIVYRSATPEINPSDTVMLRAGLTY